MKSIRYIIILAALALLPLSCRKGSPIPEESIITVPAQHETDFDKWLMSNFVNPYNIQFKYRYENNETDLNYYSVPTDYQSCIKMAHLVKYICLDSYDEVAGALFTRKYFPKEFFLMGEWEFKNNGVFTLGTAEGGKKIILMGINYLPKYMTTTANLNHYYLKTIHHEFTHILNQTVDYPILFEQVSGSTQDGYVNDGWSSSDYDDYLKSRHLERWTPRHPRYDGMLKFCREHNRTEDYQNYLEKWTDEEMANIALTLCHMVDKMMTTYQKQREEEFVKEGGIKERMTAARLGYRTNQREEIERLKRELEAAYRRIAELEEKLGRKA